VLAVEVPARVVAARALAVEVPVRVVAARVLAAGALAQAREQAQE
jgi:hypothetical protein